ncbi:molybdate ABC transporter ATP-binding protein ModF [Enterovibrio paralichthyis]|uniref:molybdate ABC transporter ATP-binding protein ModF n=1 Tax=Enterovibrio paralichthyis TaxID=2853805 RepID=UPI001C455685|nr:molybdate ABC transporter ATP-binding protein ModF [Enterovibrio paralichthyis]MBV7300324.1 molybdate ABC transporter ATP-binding protein ModF [Enterovibrio paralichthyis]
MEIQFNQLKTAGSSTPLTIDNWQIAPHQSWAVFSTEGDVGSLIGAVLCDTLPFEGTLNKGDGRIVLVSLREQQKLLEQELANDDTDFLDRIDTGTTVHDLIFDMCSDDTLCDTLIAELDLDHLKNSGFRVLSTGETRRLMLARALATQPDYLVLDNPYEGMDVAHRQSLSAYLGKLAETVQMLVVLSREADMPDWVDNVALFSQGELVEVMNKARWDAHPVIAQIAAQSEQQSDEMMALLRRYQHSTPFENPIFALTDGRVEYTEKTIFTGVNWRINKGEHWQIKGPNGAGKSTLLGMIFGDHPQCYSNNIHIFGKQRGSGETVWEIKKHIGMVSSALHLQYRVNCKALDVIISGFHDSIGLYTQPSIQERKIANEWLDILHMRQYANTPFRRLDYGQQRLLLIARAIVKQPTLLILDEPYQGLDFLGRRLMKRTLEMIARENLSQLLYVSHYQDDELESIKNTLTLVFDDRQGCYVAEVTRAAV